MGMINPTYNNRVRFKLLSREYGQIIAKEPIEWKADDLEYTRHEKRLGVFKDMSGMLTFVDDTAIWLSIIQQTQGIQAKVQLIREEKHPIQDKWVAGELMDLDMSTFEYVNKKFSIKINTSGLEELLKAREGEKIEIERTTDLNGNAISNLVLVEHPITGISSWVDPIFIEDLPVTPRNIFLYSKLVNRSGQLYSTFGRDLVPPLDVEINSDQERVTGVELNPDPVLGIGGVVPIQTFYFRNDRLKTLNISVDWRASISFAPLPSTSQTVTLSFFVGTYNNGDLDFNYWIDIATFNGNNTTNFQNFEYKTPNALPILLGVEQCLALVVKTTTALPDDVQRNMQTFKCDIEIKEDSFFEATSTKAILNHELGEKLIKIITGDKDAFYSEALGRTDIGYAQDGPQSLIAYAHGMWIRGFRKDNSDENNRYKAFTTSFKDWFDNISATAGLGLGIEKMGFKERIRIEEASYFFNRNITIRLPRKAQNVKRSYDTKKFFSGLEVGYSKGGEYEEAMGLDEYNAKSTFSTVITRVQNIFQALNPYRADSYGREFARRKPRTNYPNEDTKYDQDIFIFDLKRFFNSYKERLWQDDFEEEPTGVYSPETATGLRLSPVNTLLRHGWLIASGFLKHLNDFTRYTSSTANSGLTTKKAGQSAYSENGDILNSDLGRPRFTNEWIEFEHPVDFELMQQIKGRTFINGQWMQNVYGMVEFINENNKKEYGFLWSVKPNDKGYFKLLKAHI